MSAAPIGAMRCVPGGRLEGTVAVPGDKSITHRALILAGLAVGESTVTGALDAADTRATAAALAGLGARVRWVGGGIEIGGRGGRWLAPARALDLGNSGTGLRLLAGALVGRGVAAVLTGDASLRGRPMQRIAAPLASMGAEIATQAGRAPIVIGPRESLRGIRYRLPVASAQVKSTVLLAGLAAAGETRIEDPFRTRDHTERMLPVFGAGLRRESGALILESGPLAAAAVSVPGDFSAAAFLIAAALVSPGSRLVLPGVGINPTRTGLLAVLARMGARIGLGNRRCPGSEPLADIEVEASSLQGTRVGADEIPALIDELPVLMVLAAAATGTTVIEGAGELRHKESDRIESMRAGLAALGAEMEVVGERLVVRGGIRSGAAVDSAGDHRIAMAFAVAGMAAPGSVTISGSRWIDTSFPGFFDLIGAVGARVERA